MAATYPFWFVCSKDSSEQLIQAWPTLNKKSWTNSNKFYLFFNRKLATIKFLYMENTFTKLLQLIGINPRSLSPRNELSLSTRAIPWTITFYKPTKKGSSLIEQIVSSQEHPHFEINRKWWMEKSTTDRVLQAARCFLPHRFKRSFNITFLKFGTGMELIQLGNHE
jgi:hypothetical protein